MIEILHDLKDPKLSKLWESWYIPDYGPLQDIYIYIYILLYISYIYIYTSSTVLLRAAKLRTKAGLSGPSWTQRSFLT